MWLMQKLCAKSEIFDDQSLLPTATRKRRNSYLVNYFTISFFYLWQPCPIFSTYNEILMQIKEDGGWIKKEGNEIMEP